MWERNGKRQRCLMCEGNRCGRGRGTGCMRCENQNEPLHADKYPGLFSFFVIPAVNALNHGGFLHEKLKRGREKPAPITLCLGPRFSRNMPWELGQREY